MRDLLKWEENMSKKRTSQGKEASNAFENKEVLNLGLKQFIQFKQWVCWSDPQRRLFQKLRVRAARLWSPQVFSFEWETTRTSGAQRKHLTSNRKPESQCTEASTYCRSNHEQNFKLIVDVQQLLGLNKNTVHYNNQEEDKEDRIQWMISPSCRRGEAAKCFLIKK